MADLLHPAPVRPLPPELLAQPFTIAMAAVYGVEPWQLRGARVRRLLRGVYIGANVPVTVEVLAKAASLVSPEGAVVSCTMAALFHGADVRRSGDLDIEVTTLRESRVRRPGVRASEAYLEAGDVVVIAGIAVTSPVRTAFDLARQRDLIDRVVGIDAMLNRGGCDLAELAAYIDDRFYWRGIRWAREALTYAEPKAESPMETKQRMRLVLAGLPRPEAQHEIWTPRGIYRLDHAYKKFKVAPEYDGGDHASRWMYDNERQELIRGQDWWHRRYTSLSIQRGWELMVTEVRRALLDRGWSP